MEVSLNHLRPGNSGVIVAVGGCGTLNARLRAVGLLPGTRLRCSERSGNGQVTALLVDNRCIRLQTRDLEKIRVRL